MTLTRRNPRLASLLAGAPLALLAAAAMAGPEPAAPGEPVDLAAWRSDLEAWRADRAERLRQPDGWLTLAGLYWLREGASSAGAAEGSDLVFPAGKAPQRLGTFVLDSGAVRFAAAPGADVRHGDEPVTAIDLASDADGVPTLLTHGDLTFYVIRRGERLGVRLKDRDSPALAAFDGLEYFDADPAWRVVGRFEPYDPPKRIPIPDVVGTVNEQTSWGAVVFAADGGEHRLDVLAEPGDDELFVILADQTTGRETYGGGRYLYAAAPDEAGRVVLDFNRAYNPPCVFTPYATCPLPPRQNRLALRVEAGEKTYRGGH